jgi:uncharacterized protein (TIRG00374 family)
MEYYDQDRSQLSPVTGPDDLSDGSRAHTSQAKQVIVSIGHKLSELAKKHGKWLRWLLPAVFVVLVIQRIEWQQVVVQLLSANLALILLGAIGLFGIYWLISVWRWQVLLKALNIQYTFSQAFQLYLIGGFAGFVVSDGLGAFARGLYAERDGFSVASSMTSVFLDKLAELIGLAAFSLLGIFIFPAVIEADWLLWALVLAVLASFGLLWLFRSSLGSWASRQLDRILSKGLQSGGIDSVSSVYNRVRAITWQAWTLVAVFTLLIRLTHYGAVYVLARSIGIDLSYISIAAIMSLVGAAVVLPVSVAGGIGVREGMLVGLFALLDQPVEQGLSLGLLILLTSMSWRMIGMIFWLRNPLPYFRQT